jgi:predicted MarR family transcription regulator
MRDKNLEIEALKMQLAECGKQQGVITAAIERQNAAIEAARVDTVYVDREKQKIVARYSTIRDTVVKNIERDGSCENRLENIAGVMRRFYGVE